MQRQDNGKQLEKSHKMKRLSMSWVRLRGKTNVHHFVSAVYDDRTAAPLRPAVLVFGFVQSEQDLASSKVYCLLHYYRSSTGGGHGEETVTECLTEAAHVNKDGQCTVTYAALDSKLVTYYCSIGFGQMPTQVQLSTDRECHQNLSRPLKVLYQEQRSSYKGKVGVCLHSPLVGSDMHMEADIVNYVEMSRILGAESVTMYVSHTLDSKLKKLIEEMSNGGRGGGEEGIGEGGNKIAVELVNWHGFRLGSPLHYYGQSLLMLDCLYRHMYRVELLVFQDLDEMILPVKGGSWADMILKKDRKGRYASYQFLNTLFTPPKSDSEEAGNGEGSREASEPRYFKWTQKLDCYFPYRSRSKLIVRPDLMLTTCVHYVQRSLVERSKMTYKVPLSTGFLAHYRRTPLDQCKNSNSVTDNTALLYQKHFRKKMY